MRIGYWVALAVALCALSVAMGSLASMASDSLTVMAAEAVIDAALLVVGLHLLGFLAWLAASGTNKRDEN